MILTISDVHLGYEGCNKEAFSKFLDNYTKNIEHLVILGDLFDLWRRNNAEIIIENEDILEKLINLNAKSMHYVVGNHDYYMFNLGIRYGDNFPFTLSKNLRLSDGGNKFYFIHGYEFEVLSLEPMTIETYEDFSKRMCFSEDMIGGIASHLWDLIKTKGFKEQMEKNPRERLEDLKQTKNIYNFAVSKGKCFLLGMKNDERLVFGHTHGPFINSDKTVANTGSWIDELESKEYQNSYVEIINGNMELKFFKP